MNASSITANSFAKADGARSCTTSTANGSANLSIIKRIKQLYPNKTVQIMADWLRVSDRTAKHRLAGSRELTVEEIARLIHSEQGFEMVAAIMATATPVPAWWRICAPLMDAADIRKMQMIAQKRIAKVLEETVDADTQLRNTISRAEALAVHDEEHARPYLDALRAQGRHVHGTVAAPRKR